MDRTHSDFRLSASGYRSSCTVDIHVQFAMTVLLSSNPFTSKISSAVPVPVQHRLLNLHVSFCNLVRSIGIRLTITRRKNTASTHFVTLLLTLTTKMSQRSRKKKSNSALCNHSDELSQISRQNASFWLVRSNSFENPVE